MDSVCETFSDVILPYLHHLSPLPLIQVTCGWGLPAGRQLRVTGSPSSKTWSLSLMWNTGGKSVRNRGTDEWRQVLMMHEIDQIISVAWMVNNSFAGGVGGWLFCLSIYLCWQTWWISYLCSVYVLNAKLYHFSYKEKNSKLSLKVTKSAYQHLANSLYVLYYYLSKKITSWSIHRLPGNSHVRARLAIFLFSSLHTEPS